MRKSIFSFLCAILTASVAMADAFVTREIASATGTNGSYRLFVPSGIRQGEKLPLVVYLHGAGAKGNGDGKAEKEALPSYFTGEEFQEKHRCFVLVPQCRDGDDASGSPNNWVKWEGQKDAPPAAWTRAEEEPTDQLRVAMAALEDVISNSSVDAKRVYLCGVSMGASGSWYWASREPGRFAGVVAVCGLSEMTKAAKMAGVPVWAFHGTKDEVVPVERTNDMIGAIRKAGGNESRVTIYDGAGHDIAGKVLAEPGLFDWLFALPGGAPPVTVKEEDFEFFEKRIRPVLSEHCYECHGEKKQKGGLRLDGKSAAFAGGDLGPSIFPGDPDKSPLVVAVRYHDKDLQMPPKQALEKTKVKDLEEWVRRGAAWPDDGSVHEKAAGMVFTDEMKSHWAFQPVKKVTVPAVTSPGAVNEIDRFILSALEKEGMAISPEADKQRLIRRVTQDLTGLPPTPQETRAFVEDASPDAYAKVVERLLASPHYGERWGRHWLDVARYADSNGSEVDHAMANAWRYRDYVIRSFNADKPFDRFIREQLAGDLLPEGDGDALTATTFLMLGPKALADLDKKRLAADVIDEQVDTVFRAFNGMTMGCARCHDHKFDPLSDEDYYSVAGIFSSTTVMDMSKRVATWTERPLPGGDHAERYASLKKHISGLREERAMVAKSGKKGGKMVFAPGAEYLLVEAEDFTGGNVSVESNDLGKGIGVVRTRQEYPDHIEYEFELPVGGDYQIELRYAAKESRPTQLLVNGNLETEEAAAEVTGDWRPEAQRWFVQGIYRFHAGKNVLAFHRDGPVPLFDKWIIGLPADEPHWKKIPEAKPAADDEVKKRVAEVDGRIAKAENELAAVPLVMVPVDGPVADAPVLVRGNPATPGKVVPRGFPELLDDGKCGKPGTGQSGRRELADWLARAEHPLTARVIVNRVWLWHFGEGLVRSPDNFGLRGESPTHPELLDWLAGWFVENGWSVKKLNALICGSATYRQALLGKPSDADPENRLLSGFPRKRLDAEVLRDSMLAISGKLDRKMGGSNMTVPDRTYANGGNAPAEIVEKMNYGTSRRSVYVPVIRNALYDFFGAFDYPNPGVITGRRDRTTVAPQALFLMNSPFVTGQAEAFAKRVAEMAEDDKGRVEHAYQLAFSRSPTDTEVSRAMVYLKATAADLAAIGGAVDPREDALRKFCQTLFASNEFLYTP